jgi:glutathione S-transferase
VILYDHPVSANCLKVRILLAHLGLAYERVTVDLFTGETRRPEHLARNPDGRVPVLELDSGELLPESAAIMLYLAEGTPYLPEDRLARARVHQWLFFEQNQIEPGIAVARFMAAVGRVKKHPEVFGERLRQGRRGLESMERGLTHDFIAGEAYTVADMALYGYVHCADEAGADLAEYPRIAQWIARVEAQPGFVNDLEPITWTDS